MSDKAARLEALAEEIRALPESPLYAYRQENDYHPVIGEGDPDASILFIGEAPGGREAKTGRPFVGAAGRVLDSLLESIGLAREDVYITNVVKDRPPENRDPTAEEITCYAPYLTRQIEIIQPKVIATLGRFAMDFVLDHLDHEAQGEKISDLHGEILEATAPHGRVHVVPLYHPAASFYNQSLSATLREDFRTLKRLTGENSPAD